MMRNRLITTFAPLAAIMIVLATQPDASAQDWALRQMFPQPQTPPVPDAAEMETIRRALRDLESGSVEEQAGAAMLLGKYQFEEARQALRGALSNSEARVRRAALISILEQRTAMFSAEEAEVMLRMLGDADTEIRRHISSILSRLLASWTMNRSTMEQRADGNRHRLYPEGYSKHLERAFDDPDVVVRRNMLGNMGMLGHAIDLAPILAERLADTDSQVRLLALREGGRRMETDRFLDVVETMDSNSDPLWERELARQLNHHLDSRAERILRRLSASDDRLTALEADISLLMWESADPVQSAGYRRLREESIPADTARRAIRLLATLRARPDPRLLEPLLVASSETVRSEVILLWSGMIDELPDGKLLLELLSDRSAGVRQRTMQLLRTCGPLVSDKFVLEMVKHTRAEVRELALNLSGGREIAAEVIDHLLIDGQVTLRQRALQAAARNEIRDWHRIMQLTLRDPDPGIQRTAAEIILRSGDHDSLVVLREWVLNNPTSETAVRVAAYLGIELEGGDQ